MRKFFDFFFVTVECKIVTRTLNTAVKSNYGKFGEGAICYGVLRIIFKEGVSCGN